MDIERINEYTVKFFVSNQDIENRGFIIEDIWGNRQSGEQFLWEMLDEIQDELEFQFDGVLKIQVNVSDQGLEFVVSKSPIDFLRNKKQSKELIKFKRNKETGSDNGGSGLAPEIELTVTDSSLPVSYVFVFPDFENVVRLFKLNNASYQYTRLFCYRSNYYLEILFPEIKNEMDKETMPNGAKHLHYLALEFSDISEFSSIYLQEYGDVVIAEDVYTTLNKHF